MLIGIIIAIILTILLLDSQTNILSNIFGESSVQANQAKLEGDAIQLSRSIEVNLVRGNISSLKELEQNQGDSVADYLLSNNYIDKEVKGVSFGSQVNQNYKIQTIDGVTYIVYEVPKEFAKNANEFKNGDSSIPTCSDPSGTKYSYCLEQ